MHRTALLLVVTACQVKPGDGSALGSTSEATTAATTDATMAATTAATTDATTAATTDATTDLAPTTDGETGHPVTCEVVAQDHAQACPQEPCLIAVDTEIRCDDAEFAAPGLRVTATPDAVWMVTSSSQDSIFHRLDGEGASRVTLPANFARETILLATAPTGAVQAVAFTADDGITHVGEADGWEPSSVGGVELLDLEVALDDTPLVWTLDGPGQYSRISRVGGTWSAATAEAPAGVELEHFGFTREGLPLAVGVRFDGDSSRFVSRVEDVERELGEPLFSQVLAYRLPPPTTPVQPLTPASVAAAVQASDGIFAVYQPNLEYEGWIALHVVTTPVLSPMCQGAGAPPCPGPCHDTAVGVEVGAFAFARTTKGYGWLAYVTTHNDRTIVYEPQDDPELGAYCQATVDSDQTTGVLHFYRVMFVGNTGWEEFTLPVAAPALSDLFYEGAAGIRATPRAVDLRSYGDSLALGLRTRGSDGAPFAVRVMRIETADLPPIPRERRRRVDSHVTASNARARPPSVVWHPQPAFSAGSPVGPPAESALSVAPVPATAPVLLTAPVVATVPVLLTAPVVAPVLSLAPVLASVPELEPLGTSTVIVIGSEYSDGPLAVAVAESWYSPGSSTTRKLAS